jgi:hypothetical protein
MVLRIPEFTPRGLRVLLVGVSMARPYWPLVFVEKHNLLQFD